MSWYQFFICVHHFMNSVYWLPSIEWLVRSSLSIASMFSCIALVHHSIWRGPRLLARFPDFPFWQVSALSGVGWSSFPAYGCHASYKTTTTTETGPAFPSIQWAYSPVLTYDTTIVCDTFIFFVIILERKGVFALFCHLNPCWPAVHNIAIFFVVHEQVFE